MSRGWGCLFLTLILTFFFLFPVNASAESKPRPVLKHVFIIVADGLNYEGFVSVNCANLIHIASEGIIDEKSLAISTDTIEAAQASFVTGTFPNEHKFFTSKDKIKVETFFNVLQKYGKSYVLIDGSGGKLRPLVNSDQNYVMLNDSKSDKEVLQAAYNHFEKNAPFLTYVYLNDCMEKLITLDEKAYYKSVKNIDEQIGEFIINLRKKDLYYNSLIIITSPRSSSPSDMVPLIIKGPDCTVNVSTTGTMILDVIPTVCELLGIPKPYSTRGIPIYEAIAVPIDEREFMLNKWIAELKKERVITWNNYFDIQEELLSSINQINAIKEEKQSIFDFVGEKEEIIAKLKARITKERYFYLGVFFLMLSGYFIQYRILKRKYLLFK